MHSANLCMNAESVEFDLNEKLNGPRDSPPPCTLAWLTYVSVPPQLIMANLPKKKSKPKAKTAKVFLAHSLVGGSRHFFSVFRHLLPRARVTTRTRSQTRHAHNPASHVAHQSFSTGSHGGTREDSRARRGAPGGPQEGVSSSAYPASLHHLCTSWARSETRCVTGRRRRPGRLWPSPPVLWTVWMREQPSTLRRPPREVARLTKCSP
jgi:hypothetical protein